MGENRLGWTKRTAICTERMRRARLRLQPSVLQEKKWEFLLDRLRFPSYNVCVVKAVRKTVPFIGKFFCLAFWGKNSEPVAVGDRYE